MPLTLEQAIARVPFLRDRRDIQTSELKGGITNKNYKVEAGGKAYMLRIAGESTDVLGINRATEYAANLAAGLLGVAPQVLYFIEPEGYLVTRFIHGKRIPPDEMVKPYNIRRVVRKLRLFHTRAPELKGEFSVFRRVEHLIEISRQHGCTFPFDFDWIMGKMREVEETLKKSPHAPTPCHCDLLNLNFLDEETPGEIGEVRILDWEYAGMGDIYFDLANFSHHHRLSDELVNVLLHEYFGEVTPKAFARLKLMWPMSTVHEAMWGTTQTGLSRLDEDFQGYADLWYARTREGLTDTRWNQWLKDATQT